VIESGLQEIQSRETDTDRGVASHLFLLQRAHLQRQSGDCAAAVSSYKEVIELYSQPKLADITAYNYEAHKGLLQCYFSLGTMEAVEEELPAVLALAENNRARISSEKNRNTFFDNEQDLYDLAIEYAFSKGDAARALEYSEQSRARSLLDSMAGTPEGGSPGPIRGFNEMQAGLPGNVQVLQYAILPHEVLIWVLTRDGISTGRKAVPAEELRERILGYRSMVIENSENQREETRARAQELYEILIKPVLPFLDTAKEICFVPDKALNYLPLGSLVAGDTGRYVIEDFTVFSAPSTGVFLFSTDTARQKNLHGEEKFTGIGNPDFNRGEYPSLVDLPDAGREVRTIGRFYTNSDSFIGPAAVKKAVLSAFPKSSVFHFAGHYVVDERAPGRSKMLLARGSDEDDGSGGLEVHEILDQKLDSTKLAVLSACSTGVEGYFNGEGMFGAARAFLARGVPLVVATQWNVDSPSTAEIMIGFHRYRRQQKLSSVAALRRAQLDMLYDPGKKFSSPVFWAGFIAIGGSVPY